MRLDDYDYRYRKPAAWLRAMNMKLCSTCGRVGTWEGATGDQGGGMWCDACCEEGMAEHPAPERLQ